MSELSHITWMLITLVFYTATSLIIIGVGKFIYSRKKISAPKRRKANVSRTKVVTLFIVNSMLTGLFIKFAFQVKELGLGGLYDASFDSAWDYGKLFLETMLILFIFDANFYWTHRFLHSNKKIFHSLHAIHHEIRYPTVWHLQYNWPLEWIISVALPILVVALLPLPLSVAALMLACIVTVFSMVGGHSGYEFNGSAFSLFTINGWVAQLDKNRRGVGKYVNNVLHHDLHHQRVRVNFGLYFSVWDRIGRTYDPDTDDENKFLDQEKPTPVDRS